MVDEFKIGYYYKYIGDKDKYFYWGDMNLVLDGKWHKCISIDGFYAQFEGMKKDWYWNKKNFIESKYPTEWKVKKLLKEI